MFTLDFISKKIIQILVCRNCRNDWDASSAAAGQHTVLRRQFHGVRGDIDRRWKVVSEPLWERFGVRNWISIFFYTVTVMLNGATTTSLSRVPSHSGVRRVNSVNPGRILVAMLRKLCLSRSPKKPQNPPHPPKKLKLMNILKSLRVDTTCWDQSRNLRSHWTTFTVRISRFSPAVFVHLLCWVEWSVNRVKMCYVAVDEIDDARCAAIVWRSFIRRRFAHRAKVEFHFTTWNMLVRRASIKEQAIVHPMRQHWNFVIASPNILPSSWAQFNLLKLMTFKCFPLSRGNPVQITSFSRLRQNSSRGEEGERRRVSFRMKHHRWGRIMLLMMRKCFENVRLEIIWVEFIMDR